MWRTTVWLTFLVNYETSLILTKEESMVEIFLDLISEFNIKFNQEEKEYISENKKSL